MNKLGKVAVAAVALVGGLSVFAADCVSVKPLALYRTEKAQDVQFYDAAGRALFLGAHPGAKLVVAPLGAVRANVPLKEAEVGKAGLPIDDPSFWRETSKVELNTGDHLKVRRGGYAVSAFVPATCDLALTPDKNGQRTHYSQCFHRLWYDRDLNELSQNISQHLGATHAPTNAAYVRFLVPWSPYDQFRELRLVPANYAKRRDYGPEGSAHPGEIVLPARPKCQEVYAAAQLVKETRTVTGRTLPVVSAPTEGAAFHIWIGRNPGGVKVDKEGFAIVRRGRDVYAFGNHPRGTIIAATELVKRVSDFFWWRPDRTCGLSFTPCAALDFLSVADANETPAFPMRTFSGGNPLVQYAYNDWIVWHRCFRAYRAGDVFGASQYHAKSHGFYAIVGGSFMELAMDGGARDEFFPMENGRRRVGSMVGQPCYGNPACVKATLEAVERRLEAAPDDWEGFNFNYSDDWICCECPDCQKPIKLPQGGELVCKSPNAHVDPEFRSTRTYLVANEIARIVRRHSPGKRVFMLSYYYTAALPAVKLEPEISLLHCIFCKRTLRFGIMTQDEKRPFGRASWPELLSAWIKREPQATGLYDYYYSAIPALYAEPAKANLEMLAKAGALRSHVETQYDVPNRSCGSFGTESSLWDLNALDQVLLAELDWNPHQDVGALRSAALRRMYGEDAAAEMEAFYRIFARKWFDRSYEAWVADETPATEVYVNFVSRPKIEQRLMDCLERAKAKAATPAGRRQLERMIGVMKAIKAATGREELPLVQLLDAEWKDPDSVRWGWAHTVRDFRNALPDVTNPEEMTCDLAKTPPSPAKVKTEVDLAADSRYLYYRVRPGKGGGYVELDFFVKDAPRRFFAPADKVTTGRIPLCAVREKPEAEIVYVFRRFDAKGNVSFGRAASNVSRQFPGEGWRANSKLVTAVESVFDPSDDPKLGLNVKPPMSFPDAELAASPLNEMFPTGGRHDGGKGIRRVRGVPVFDSGYGYGFSRRFDAKAGEMWRISGDRWKYHGYAPVEVWFYGEKGKIRDISMPNANQKPDGTFALDFACPPGTTSFSVIFYNSYVKQLKAVRR